MFQIRDPRRGLRSAGEPPAGAARPETVSAFDADLAAIAAATLRLGGLAEEALSEALSALGAGGAERARRAAERRERLSGEARALSGRAAAALARRRRAGADLRLVLGALRAASALGRVGDLGANIAARAAALGAQGRAPGGPEAMAARLGARALAQLSEALSAHQARDALRARAVWRRDGELDAHYESLAASLVARMTADPAEIARGAEWLFMVKDLERIGDQARRIAAATWWTVTGEEIDAPRPEG
ncbi:MAG: phosphate signaling complex PhoU family protein [Pseudomonadota bacterium]